MTCRRFDKTCWFAGEYPEGKGPCGKRCYLEYATIESLLRELYQLPDKDEPGRVDGVPLPEEGVGGK